MKSILVTACLFIAVLSCRKVEIENANLKKSNDFISEFVKNKVSAEDYNQLDLSRRYVSRFPTVSFEYIRVPFKNSTEFLLLKKEVSGVVLEGKLIQIEKEKIQKDQSIYQYNGLIVISSLDRKNIVTSRISNGFIEAFHTNLPVL